MYLLTIITQSLFQKYDGQNRIKSFYIFTKSNYNFSISKQTLIRTKQKIVFHVCNTGARGTDLPPPFFLTFGLQIYFQ